MTITHCLNVCQLQSSTVSVVTIGHCLMRIQRLCTASVILLELAFICELRLCAPCGSGSTKVPDGQDCTRWISSGWGCAHQPKDFRQNICALKPIPFACVPSAHPAAFLLECNVQSEFATKQDQTSRTKNNEQQCVNVQIFAPALLVASTNFSSKHMNPESLELIVCSFTSSCQLHRLLSAHKRKSCFGQKRNKSRSFTKKDKVWVQNNESEQLRTWTSLCRWQRPQIWWQGSWKEQRSASRLRSKIALSLIPLVIMIVILIL